MSTTDAIALGLLVAFALWGAWRGTLRQVAELGVMTAAFPVATRLHGKLDGLLSKLASLGPADRADLGWAVVFSGVLLAGGVLVHLLQPALRRVVPRGLFDGLLGATLGVVRGVVLLAVLTYGILRAGAGNDPPSWVAEVGRSRAAAFARDLRHRVEPLPPLPAALRARLDLLDRRTIDAADVVGDRGGARANPGR